MLFRWRIQKSLLWVINLLAVYTLLFTLFRMATLVLFKPAGEPAAGLASSFLLGLRFDLRWIAIVLLPVAAAGLYQPFSPFSSNRNRQFWTAYLATATFFIFFFFAADFTAFSYNRTRLGASALNFLEDAAISVRMIWQSYPIVWILAGLVAAAVLLKRLFRQSHRRVAEHATHCNIPDRRLPVCAVIVLFCFFIYGGYPTPLKSNAAFQMKNDFCGVLALNPLQTFFSTLNHRKPQADKGRARELYPVMSEWMDWDDAATGYRRVHQPVAGRWANKPNVVLVVCESFSMYKTSMSGNALNTTPYFKSLCDSGLFFSRCFTPHFSTARGMFALVTGTPDVQLAKFSTRTEAAKDQHTIINNFSGYNKFYFLGGSPAFNNFAGLIQNVNGVQMVTEGAFASRPIDVWGISDKALFLEANRWFAKQQSPFFAVIQTSDNHPPYSIDAQDSDFKPGHPSRTDLETYGFESAAQYNAMRYFDYSVRAFLESAKKEAYFKNTLFVFVGDHGIAGNAAAVYPKEWTDQRLTEMHVPLLFYAPGCVPAEERNETVSQVDVLPTAAALAGQAYENTTLGRNLVRPSRHPSAFFIRHDEGEVGVITDEFYFAKNILFEKERLLPRKAGVAYTKAQTDSVQKRLSLVASGYLETARWMLLNNRQQR